MLAGIRGDEAAAVAFFDHHDHESTASLSVAVAINRMAISGLEIGVHPGNAGSNLSGITFRGDPIRDSAIPFANAHFFIRSSSPSAHARLTL